MGESAPRRTPTGRYVKESAGWFSGLSRWKRVILAPVYGLLAMYLCVAGEDVSVNRLHDRDYEPTVNHRQRLYCPECRNRVDNRWYPDEDGQDIEA